MTGSDTTRKPGYQHKKYDRNTKKGHGLVASAKNNLFTATNINKEKKVINICGKCKHEVGRGKSHKCYISSASINIISHAAELPKKQIDQITSKLLFQKAGQKKTERIAIRIEYKRIQVKSYTESREGKGNCSNNP